MSSLFSRLPIFGKSKSKRTRLHSLTQSTNQERLKKIPDLPDVRVQVGGRIFACHRHILASHSRYFEALFAGNFRDAYEDTTSLPAEYVSEGSFSTVLNAMYGEEYSIEDDLLSVFVASSYLQYELLTDTCAKYIVSNLEYLNQLIPLLLSLPQLIECPSLHDAVVKHSCRHFSEVFRRSRSTCREVPFDVLEKLLKQKDLLIFNAVPALKFCTLWLTECQMEHHGKTIESLLTLYRIYQSSEVMAQCERYMRENYSADDMMELFASFRDNKTKNQPSYEFARLYLRQNFSKIMPAKKLWTISFERLRDLLRDARSFDLDSCSGHVVRFVSRWCSHYPGYMRQSVRLDLFYLSRPYSRHYSRTVRMTRVMRIPLEDDILVIDSFDVLGFLII